MQRRMCVVGRHDGEVELLAELEDAAIQYCLVLRIVRLDL